MGKISRGVSLAVRLKNVFMVGYDTPSWAVLECEDVFVPGVVAIFSEDLIYNVSHRPTLEPEPLIMTDGPPYKTNTPTET